MVFIVELIKRYHTMTPHSGGFRYSLVGMIRRVQYHRNSKLYGFIALLRLQTRDIVIHMCGMDGIVEIQIMATDIYLL